MLKLSAEIFISRVIKIILLTSYLSLSFEVGFADQQDSLDLELVNNISLPEKVEATNNLKLQLELIVFGNLDDHSLMINKENFKNSLSLSNVVGTDLQHSSIPIKFLLPAYEKIIKQTNYKIIAYAATRYELLSQQKIKKFFLKADLDPVKFAYDPNMHGQFIVNLTIDHRVKNLIHIKFDGGNAKLRLTRSVRIRSKEIYYFDHPKFGALLTVVELRS